MNKHFLICVIFIVMEANISLQIDFVVFGDDMINKLIVKRNVAPALPRIKEFVVKTRVANRFAETNVSSKVENIDTYAKQTTFSVVLPERAFISGFYMEMEGKTYKAFVKEKEEAKRIYDQSVSSGRTAAHVAVSTRNANRFTINVNVEPESKATFHLTYEELLQRKNGQYEIIANIQPGQIVKKLEVEVEIKENRPLLFVRTPSLRSGNILVQNNTNLDPNAKVHVSNSTASVKFYPDINRQLEFACAGLGNKEYDGFAGQFVVQYDIERDIQGGETLFQDGFFINFFAPPNLEPIAKHIIFVLDTSGSMDGMKITQLKEAMMGILPQLYEDDLFSIVQYAAEVYLWDLDLNSIDVLPVSPNYGNLASQIQNTPIPDAALATKENIEKAKSIINQLIADGGTNSIAGLEVGLYLVKLVQDKYKDQYQPLLVFLTDGLPNVGIDDTTQIISLITTINSREYKTPIYSLCIGNDADWSFLQELSLATGATPTRIHTEGGEYSGVSGQLKSFYEIIRTPVLTNVTVNTPQSSELTKTHFPIFFDGSEIIIAGKNVSTNGTKPITISARGKQGPMELEAKIGIPLTRLERVWAYLTVKQLLDEIHATSSQYNKTELSKLALDIALKYSLVTDLTSLIVVRPNDTNSAVNAIDASAGIFPESPNELPMCDNITNWIITNFGTPEPTTVETTTTTTTTTPKPTTTMPKPTTTTSKTTTTEADIGFIGESEFGVATITEPPTTTQATTTTKRIKTCKETPFGCCHDGVTTAAGANYSGCDPIPKAESCSLPEDKGPCTVYSEKWLYDNKLGQCRSFWYGGCEGNGNRFKSKQECEETCINAVGPDRCTLPIFYGSCGKYEPYYFYDKQKDECVKFMYSGCLGNTNRFRTKQECLQLCGSNTKEISLQDGCPLPVDHGTCRKFEIQYYYDSPLGACRSFWYGGCGGNDNRFKTIAECEKICINPDGQDVCKLPPVKGTCTESHRQWYYDKKKQSCLQFTYSGCRGNANKFNSREECYKRCAVGLSASAQDACYLKEDRGSCDNYTTKWIFNRKQGRCVQFWYGGCDGNDNRFDSEKSCKEVCINPLGKDKCKLPKVPGPCQEKLTRWYYNKNKGQCKKFLYGGCLGNSNNFGSLNECKKDCT